MRYINLINNNFLRSICSKIKLLGWLIDNKTTIVNKFSRSRCCRLIPLNENVGVRPIEVGEVMRCVIGKAINWVLKEDIQEAAGPLQTATGLKAGAEAAIHSMRAIFEDNSTEAIILVDASNALNSLNRKVALHNIQITCHTFSYILINPYRNPSRMIIFRQVKAH